MTMNSAFSFMASGAVQYVSASLLQNTGFVRHGFSTRVGGVSHGDFSSLNLGVHTSDSQENVKENFKCFCAAICVSEKTLVLANQVHSSEIRIVTKSDCGIGLERPGFPGVDGLITAEPGVALATFYADCTPFLLFDPKKKVIASVHSGWRGTLARIGRKAVQTMRREFGCRPEDILAVSGPSIKQCHFEVGWDVFSDFLQMFGNRRLRNTVFHNDKYFLDTDQLNQEQLLEEGLLPEHIAMCMECTCCNPARYYSHRYSHGATGRMCAVISLK